ncbi:hypothetical protein [Rubritalea sp.]|uniref:hypothetical protein n=1 Tax=Rubritalea sp. TaxID=2109375 RepID=UPI0032423255
MSKRSIHDATFPRFVVGENFMAAWSFGGKPLIEAEFYVCETLCTLNLVNGIPFEST